MFPSDEETASPIIRFSKKMASATTAVYQQTKQVVSNLAQSMLDKSSDDESSKFPSMASCTYSDYLNALYHCPEPSENVSESDISAGSIMLSNEQYNSFAELSLSTLSNLNESYSAHVSPISSPKKEDDNAENLTKLPLNRKRSYSI